MGASSAKASATRGAPWPAGLLLAGSLGAMLALQVVPPQGAGMAAPWFPPGLPQGEANGRIAAADGRLVTAGGVAGLWIVFSERTGFAGRLYGAGAWLVLDAGGASGCLGNGCRLPRPAPEVTQAARGARSMSTDVGEMSAVAGRTHGLRAEIARFLDRLRGA